LLHIVFIAVVDIDIIIIIIIIGHRRIAGQHPRDASSF
jgi:hypothetical protein